ncbi:MAG: fatty acid desaturase [Spirochaetia bacterium]|nr:fatty acid desaturase [Spirochaetia bacterium]
MTTNSMNLTKTITISDPIATSKKLNLVDKLIMKFINEERDLPIGHLILKISLTMIPLAFLIFMIRSFNIYLAVVYAVFFARFFGPYHLMLHNISHRKLFKNKFSLFNYYPTWFMGIFFGQSPETYYAHHIQMHHFENNLLSDKSSTLKYRRDSFSDCMIYFFRFITIGLWETMLYFIQTKKYKAAFKVFAGEYSYWLFMAAVSYYYLPAGIFLFVTPYIISRAVMIIGNWTQHAFVDVNDPNNCYRNSISCINGKYNHLCFNDGYHISHHLKASRHWSDHPHEIIENKANYIKENAIVFEKIDFLGVWFLLMLKQHKKLAKYFVNLNEKKPKTENQILALFEERLIPISQK